MCVAPGFLNLKSEFDSRRGHDQRRQRRDRRQRRELLDCDAGVDLPTDPFGYRLLSIGHARSARFPHPGQAQFRALFHGLNTPQPATDFLHLRAEPRVTTDP
jgi:hypothetical protein